MLKADYMLIRLVGLNMSVNFTLKFGAIPEKTF